MLQKTTKLRREKEEQKKKEVYFAGDRNYLTSKFSSSQKRVLERFPDFEDAIASRLEDYTAFTGESTQEGARLYGGPIPDKVWTATLTDESGREIDLTIIQSYCQPGARLHYAEVELSYDPGIAEKDLNIVRTAIKKSGLEKKTG